VPRSSLVLARAGLFLSLTSQTLIENLGLKKLKYVHRNPVKRGLVERPEDWAWSSFRHYVTGESGVVEIESPWTEYYRATKGPALAKTGLERGTQIS
jgi:hypothetical protein